MKTPDKPQKPNTEGDAGELEGLDAARLMEAALRGETTPPSGAPPWEPPPPEALAGLIPGYEITELLGRGGMGAVYKAIQTILDRAVAIKFLPPDLGADPGFEARFRREAQSMARLNHSNIVQIYDYGRTGGGQHYFVMEYVDGSDLHQLVRSGRLDADGALIAVIQICQALQYAHELGFVHRDIKPANILMNRQGILKVGDFGLAKLIDRHDPADQPPAGERMRLTLSGAAMGTPYYVAPEQMDGEGAVDHRADLYSLGVMFYEMLTRELPRGTARPPSRKIAALDVRIDGVVFKAMDPDPGERYQTAVELRADVEHIRQTPPPPDGGEPEPLSPDLPDLMPPMPPEEATATGSLYYHQPSADEILSTTRSLNTTLLVLGLIAVLTMGALALFLAQRKTGDVINTETTVTNQEVHNTYFSQLIAIGVTTARDLEAVTGLRPYGGGFIGISRDALSWERSTDLARRTGAEILSVGETGNGNGDRSGAGNGPGAEASLLAWVSVSYSAEAAETLWVRESGQARLLRGPALLSAADLNAPRRALLRWGAAGEGQPPEGPGLRTADLAAAARDSKSPAASSLSENPEPVPRAADSGAEAIPAGSPPAPSPAPAAAATATAAAAAPSAAPPSARAEHPVTSWTNAGGKVIQARFVGLSGEAVVVLMDGRRFTIPFSRLSPASVAQAKKAAVSGP